MRLKLLRILPPLAGIGIVAIMSWAATKGLNLVVAIATIVAAVPVIGYVMSLGRSASQASPLASTPLQVDLAVRKLAYLALSQWREEIEMRHLDDPSAVAVRWHMTELDVMDHAKHILARRGKIRFEGRSDRIADLAMSFRSLKRRRLVILGDRGMGKTTLAVLLLRELLEHPLQEEPIPVLFSLADFDPDGEELRTWLVRRLASDYPALRAPDYGSTAVSELIYGRKILPILDGLDELPAAIRPKVISALNDAAGDTVILTCRTAEYLTAIEESADVLTAAAVIEPDPLDPHDVIVFLKACLPPPALQGGSWVAVLNKLRSQPRGALATALATPFALWLLCQVYITANKDPAPLLEREKYPTTETIRNHLLDHLIPAVLAARPPANDNARDKHPFRPKHRWADDSVSHWLGYLARHFPSRDLAWWQLRNSIPQRSAALTPVVGDAVIVGIGAGIPITILDVNWGGVGLGLVLSVTYMLIFGIASGTKIRYKSPTRLISILILGGFACSGMFWIVFSFMARVPGANQASLLIGFVFMLPFSLAYWLRGEINPSMVNLRLHGRAHEIPRIISGVADKAGLSVFLAGGISGITVEWITGAFNTQRQSDLLGLIISSGVMIGATLALIFTFTAGLLEWAQNPVPTDRPSSPRSTLRADLQLGGLRILAVGLPVIILISVIFAHSDGILGALAVAISLGFSFGLMAGLGSPGDVYLLVKMRLWLTGKLPWRLMSFLEDAHRLELLRQVGPVYQFRHADLQDRLALQQQEGALLRSP